MPSFSLSSFFFFLFAVIILIIASKQPNVKNAPGGKIIIETGWKLLPNKDIPAKVPAPRISLTAAIRINAHVKPRPIPNPSTAERPTEFLLAKASALPRIIQFTTIRGI